MSDILVLKRLEEKVLKALFQIKNQKEKLIIFLHLSRQRIN